MTKLETLEEMHDYIREWLENVRKDCAYTQEKLDKATAEGKDTILALTEYVKATTAYSVLADLYLAIKL